MVETPSLPLAGCEVASGTPGTERTTGTARYSRFPGGSNSKRDNFLGRPEQLRELRPAEGECPLQVMEDARRRDGQAENATRWIEVDVVAHQHAAIHCLEAVRVDPATERPFTLFLDEQALGLEGRQRGDGAVRDAPAPSADHNTGAETEAFGSVFQAEVQLGWGHQRHAGRLRQEVENVLQCAAESLRRVKNGHAVDLFPRPSRRSERPARGGTIV